MPDLITVRQVAELLQLNEAHVRDRVSKQRGFPACSWCVRLVPEVGSEQLGVARLSGALA